MSDAFTEFGSLNYDRNEIAQRGYGVASSGPNDENLIVLFYPKSVLNVAKSQEAGKRICEVRDYVKIQHPGESLNIVDRGVQESDKRRWPQQWARFAQGKQQTPEGIPVTLLFPSQPNISDMLTGYNILTVEQLANLSGHAISTIGMGCQEWVNKAQSYLKQAEKGVDFHRFDKAIAEKDREIAKLTRQVNELGKQMAQIVRPDPKDFDVQVSQITNTKAVEMQELSNPHVVTFNQGITSPDLSGEVKPRKQRSDKGKARGPRTGVGNG